MYQIILMLHVVFAVALIGLILIQQGKGAAAGSAFGAGASGTVFGSKGAGSFMLKITAFFGLLFFVTSLLLTHMATSQKHTTQKDSLLDNVAALSKAQHKQTKTPSTGAQKAIDALSVTGPAADKPVK
ncbi:MAG: preprotein translocase subunit SecG [Gammaproteobacteria bacterium CG11_big_fil_rev_8_21_14_0_20_46_22]|nr:MAG: preprotein translocase subunit SecG [Gammaproteobacteria bacterium CG12_big_fil_rev_8_21_14_0_65_46_12]PIR11406.1 MAG: preprotein translocase subunit SecG [Gammaproteobacteria bacterium CG11_big_fil_rev_8_21_14_0_20_46_22]